MGDSNRTEVPNPTLLNPEMNDGGKSRALTDKFISSFTERGITKLEWKGRSVSV
jgi:hypothetical protein